MSLQMSFEIFTFIDCRQFNQVEATLYCWCDVKIQLLTHLPTGKELTLVMLPSGKMKIQCNGNAQLMVNVCMPACVCAMCGVQVCMQQNIHPMVSMASQRDWWGINCLPDLTVENNYNAY